MKKMQIGTLRINKDGELVDDAVKEWESECMICNELTDHASGVCDNCASQCERLDTQLFKRVQLVA